MQPPADGADYRVVLPQFTVEVRSDANQFYVILEGDLDIATAPWLDLVLDAVVCDGHPRVVVDLDSLNFMDSVGLSSMLRARNGAHANHHRLTVRGGSLQVRRLLDVTGMQAQLGNDGSTDDSEDPAEVAGD